MSETCSYFTATSMQNESKSHSLSLKKSQYFKPHKSSLTLKDSLVLQIDLLAQMGLDMIQNTFSFKQEPGGTFTVLKGWSKTLVHWS